MQQASGLGGDIFDAALDALCHHDVVTCHEGRCRFTVELMRRWVADSRMVK